MYDPKETVENQEDKHEVTEEQDNVIVDSHGRDKDEPVYGESYEEEFAQEAAIPIHEGARKQERETRMQEDVNAGMGWLGLTAAILSFFFAPVILGAAGIILGIVGKRRGANTLGNMAIIISIISIAFALFFAPFYEMI